MKKIFAAGGALLLLSLSGCYYPYPAPAPYYPPAGPPPVAYAAPAPVAYAVPAPYPYYAPGYYPPAVYGGPVIGIGFGGGYWHRR